MAEERTIKKRVGEINPHSFRNLKKKVNITCKNLSMLHRAIHLVITPENMNSEVMQYWIEKLPVIEEALESLQSKDVEMQIQTLCQPWIKEFIRRDS